MQKFTTREFTSTSVGLPLQYSALDHDLDERFGALPGNTNFAWGLAVAAVDNAWVTETTVSGIDWSAVFLPANTLRTPLPQRAANGRTRWRKARRTAVLMSVLTNTRSVNEARDFGRPAVRGLLALLRREIPSLLAGETLWEGVMVQVRKGRLGMTYSGTETEAREPASTTLIHASTMPLVRVDLKNLPSYVVRSLQWLQMARASQVKVDQFIHMWLAALALASYGHPSGTDIGRITRYVRQLGFGIGGVVSRAQQDILLDVFQRASTARNRLMHRDDETRITLDLLDKLEAGVFELIDFELRRAGMAGVRVR